MKQKRIHLSWPENRLQSSRTTEVELRLYGKSKPSGVLPLKCDSWTVLQNPDFKFFHFPVRIYNYYRFPEMPGPETKIYHFKEDEKVRPCFNRIVSQLETPLHSLQDS